MKEILTRMATSISEFKKNPNLEVKKAEGEPFAVLTNNKPSFYVLSPEHFEALCEQLWESDITPTVLNRLQNLDDTVKVNIDEI